MTVFRNVHGFSVDVEEAQHHGHEITAGELFSEERYSKDEDDMDLKVAHCYCHECDVTFIAYEEEIFESWTE